MTAGFYRPGLRDALRMQRYSNISGVLAIAPGRFNPAATDSKITLSNSDATALRSTTSSGTWCMTLGLTARSSGNYYAELANDANGSSNGSLIFGVALSTASLTSYLGSDASGWGIQANNTIDNAVYHGGTQTNSGAGSSCTRAMVAYAAASGKIWLGKNGIWFNSGDPATGVNPTYTTTPGSVLYLALSESSNPQQCTLKNGAGENIYTLPSTFTMWG